jgi:hypothetical protein
VRAGVCYQPWHPFPKEFIGRARVLRSKLGLASIGASERMQVLQKRAVRDYKRLGKPPSWPRPNSRVTSRQIGKAREMADFEGRRGH